MSAWAKSTKISSRENLYLCNILLAAQVGKHGGLALGGQDMLRQHLNFRQISHRFTSSFTNPSFQDLNGSHIMHWNMIILNLLRFKVEPHSKYWYFCIERVDLLSLRFSENAVLFHI